MYEDQESAGGSVSSHRRLVRHESTGPCQLMSNYVKALQNSVICVILNMVIEPGVAISSLAIGILYVNDCPTEEYIPIYLIVMGALLLTHYLVSLFWNFYSLMHYPESAMEDDESVSFCRGMLANTLGLVMFGWFIAGNVFVFGLYGNYSDVYTDYNYCNNLVYLYAFVFIISLWIWGVFVFFIMCCCFCCDDERRIP